MESRWRRAPLWWWDRRLLRRPTPTTTTPTSFARRSPSRGSWSTSRRSKRSPMPRAATAWRAAPGYDDSADYVADAGRGGRLRRRRAGVRIHARLPRRLRGPGAERRGWHRVRRWIAGASSAVTSARCSSPPPTASTSRRQYGRSIWRCRRSAHRTRAPAAARRPTTPACRPGAIIIVQRGSCMFAEKFLLADASPAGAMVFINEGQPGRTTSRCGSTSTASTSRPSRPRSRPEPSWRTVCSSGDTGLTARFKIDWRPGPTPRPTSSPRPPAATRTT